MRPHVTLHTAVSVDGRIDHLDLDLAVFYKLAGKLEEDCTLAGSETIVRAPLARSASDGPPFAAKPGDRRPLLAIPDSRGRVRTWPALRDAGLWRAGVALVTQATPKAYLDRLKRWGVEALAAGKVRVDFRAALEKLHARYGIERVRVDSGGTLNGVLLRAGLVDEVSVLVEPALVGGTSPRSMFRAPDLASGEGAIAVRLTGLRRVGERAWLRYEVVR